MKFKQITRLSSPNILFFVSSQKKYELKVSDLKTKIQDFLSVNINGIKLVKIKNKKLFFDVFENKLLIFLNICILKNENLTEKKIEINKKLGNFLLHQFQIEEYVLNIVFCGFY
ncbi:hypothetical protein [Mycoplasma sp. SG1]|uniref:hypothetical protein n=1 Tax=Mycoplasma sp. SG1 TaxID=2810348 RepID=UPI002024F2FC|nr:hypothetical protein [Mycoplasma sp. SG1]URM53120.1 hypothetical protein JRW51_02100 [Mycoplasma sp. SG1]